MTPTQTLIAIENNAPDHVSRTVLESKRTHDGGYIVLVEQSSKASGATEWVTYYADPTGATSNGTYFGEPEKAAADFGARS